MPKSPETVKPPKNDARLHVKAAVEALKAAVKSSEEPSFLVTEPRGWVMRQLIAQHLEKLSETLGVMKE